VEPGFLSVEGKTKDKRSLTESLPKGSTVFLAAPPQVVDKETLPPARYTQATLLTAMETCGRQVPETKLRNALVAGIGTASTRASTIEKLIRQKWIAQRGAQLEASSEAITFIRQLRGSLDMKELSTVELTGNWECQLKKIEEGIAKKGPADKGIKQVVERMVATAARIKSEAGKDARTLNQVCAKKRQVAKIGKSAKVLSKTH